MELTVKFIKKRLNKLFTPQRRQAELNDCLTQLSHDINNNLITIRVIAGNLKKKLAQHNPDLMVEQEISHINKLVDYAGLHLEMYRILLTKPGFSASDKKIFSFVECFNEAMATYPFPSMLSVSSINITNSDIDFSINAPKILTLHMLYCIIREAVDMFYSDRSSSITITLYKNDTRNVVSILIPTNPLKEVKYFSLGTPSKPGRGFDFIKSVILKSDAKLQFRKHPSGCSTLELQYPSINLHTN